MSYEVKRCFIVRAQYKAIEGQIPKEPEEMYFDFLEEAELEAENCRKDPDFEVVDVYEDYAELWIPDEF